MAIRLKASVHPQGIRGEILLALLVLESVFKERDIDLVVTSANDSKHKRGSLHYQGCAVDLRTKHVPRGQLNQLIQECREALPLGYDLILEGLNSDNEHAHLEWDPKPAAPAVV